MRLAARSSTLRLAAVVAVLVAAVGFVALRAASPAQAAPAVSTNVQVFYYPWYGSQPFSGAWRHWNGNGITPPDNITSNFYPVEGAYDSGDPAVLAQQMQWIAQAGVGTLVYSWWGQGSWEDQHVPAVMSAAAQYGIKVAWHIEPYGNRTAASVVGDINYLNAHYGSSPAFYRDSAHGDKPAFYIFDSLLVTDWSAIVPLLPGNLILAQTTDVSKVADFNGMYTYDGIAAQNPGNWAGVGAYCAAHGMVWAPSVAPGYLDDKAVPGNTTPTVDRNNGAAYDNEWTNAVTPSIGGNPTWVSITSFNEWHEGSQIEPASVNPPAGFGYLTYNGAYGLTGTASQTAYLDRTRYWVSRFTDGAVPPPASGSPSTLPSVSRPPSASPSPTAGQPPAGTNLALRKAAGGTSTQGFVPTNAVDGDQNTYWESANNTFPQNFTVDLGATYVVNRIVLKLPPSWGARTVTLAVQKSTDASTYATVVPSAAYRFDPATGNTVTITFAATSARYLRLAVTANTGWPAAQLSEFEAYGPGASPTPTQTPSPTPSPSRTPTPSPTPSPTPPANANLALGRPVADTGHADVYVAANTVDGNPSSYWESVNNAFPQSVTVDLGAPTTVGRIVLRVPPAAGWATRTQTLSVSGSLDNAAYPTLVGSAPYTFNPATGNTATVTFTRTPVRYLRLTFTANTGWPAGQLSEFEVYAS